MTQSTEFLTPTEVSGILKVSTDTVMRKFSKLKGVIDMGQPESRFKRQYRSIRIPRTVLEKFIFESGV